MELSDRVFDLVEDELKRRDPKNPLLKLVGTPPPLKAKVKLPFYLPSLDKVKADTVDKWIERHSGPYVVMDKLDGVSLGIAGSKLYTRGDGKFGQDLSHLTSALIRLKKLPKIPDSYHVRCEVICSENNFQKLFKGEKNARNTVSGLLNRKDMLSPATLKALDIIAYEIINPPMTPSAQLAKLKALKFKVVPHSIIQDIDTYKLEGHLLKRKKVSPYAIDGIVIYQDLKAPRVTSGNPKHAVAFKSELTTPSAKAKVLEVVWQVSKHGYLKPVGVIEPTILSGVVIKRVTLYNAEYVVTNKIGKGTVVELKRSGDVIPKVIRVIKPTKPDMPTRDYIWNESNVDIMLPKAAEDSEMLIRRAAFFFETIGVKDFSIGLVTKLFGNGIDSIAAICKATEEDLLQLPGIQEKTASKIVSNIKEALINIPLHTLMYASGTFGRLLGSKRLKEIIDLEGKNALKITKGMVERIAGLTGFTEKTALMYTEGLPAFNTFLRTIPVKYTLPKKGAKSKALAGHVILFTGYRDKALEAVIESHSGTVVTGFSSKVTIVITKDINSTSGKAQRARARGIPIMTPEAFKKRYL